MKKIMLLFIVVAILLFSNTQGITHGINKKENLRMRTKNIQNNVKEWTFMFYDDADFYRAGDPLEDFANSAYSGNNLNVIVLQDTESGPARIWYITNNHKKVLLEELGEVNMGSYQTLRDFIEYSKTKYPANRYIIALYDHGYGWMGACTDDTSNDLLSMEEMRKAITETGKVDIICFTAPCEMAAIESVYELKDCTDVYIGSEAGSTYYCWKDIVDDICWYLNYKIDMNNTEIGRNIIKLIELQSKYWPSTLKRKFTMSAIRTDKMQKLGEALKSLTNAFINDFNNSYESVWSAYEISQKIDIDLLDFYNFAESCLSFVENQSIREKLEHVMKCLEEAIIQECHGVYYPNSHGLSIYFPDSIWNYSIYYSWQLRFNNDTDWDYFLHTYFYGKPVVKIKDIKGDFGKIVVVLSNDGKKDAENVKWWFNVDGPNLLFGRKNYTGVASIPGETVINIKSDFTFGFGQISVKASLGTHSKRVGYGYIIGPLIIVHSWG